MYNCFQKVHDSVDDSLTCLMLKTYWLDQQLVMFPKDIGKQLRVSRVSLQSLEAASKEAEEPFFSSQILKCNIRVLRTRKGKDYSTTQRLTMIWTL